MSLRRTGPVRRWWAVTAGQTVLVLAGVVALAGIRGRALLPAQGADPGSDPVPEIAVVAAVLLLAGLPLLVARVAHRVAALRRGTTALACATLAGAGALLVSGSDLRSPLVLSLGVAAAVALPGAALRSAAARALVVTALTFISATADGIGDLVPLVVLPAVAAVDRLARRPPGSGDGRQKPSLPDRGRARPPCAG